MPMETISEALQRLSSAGYVDDYRAEAGGLRGRSSMTVHSPDALRVDEVVRFEGDSDPGEECAIFALFSQVDGTKGTYTVAFGPTMDSLDADMVRQLGTRTR